MKILITAGGTKEYIDGVRYIGNSSSGRTGAKLADYLHHLGHEVIWLGAQNAIQPKLEVQSQKYETFDELANCLQSLLNDVSFDLIFHAAAVSDFKVVSVVLNNKNFVAGREVKLPSAEKVQLQLEAQPKLIQSIKTWSTNKSIHVVAFKLTNTLDVKARQAAVDKLVKQRVIDHVAHNDLHEITDASHAFVLHNKKTSIACSGIKQLADKVLSQVEKSA